MMLPFPQFRSDTLRSARYEASSDRKWDIVDKQFIFLLVSVSLTVVMPKPSHAIMIGPIPDGNVPALIDAIEAANDEGVNPGSDTIILAPNGTYSLSMTADPRIPFSQEGNNGLPSISSTLIIQGNRSVIERDASLFSDSEDQCSGLNAEDKFRIIHVTGNLTLDQLTIKNGCADSFDGGFENIGGGLFIKWGTVTLSRSLVSNNTATDGGAGGGAIGLYGSSSSVTLLDSTVKDNMTTGQGAGIFNLGGEVNLTNSMVSRNHANHEGGGIGNLGGELRLRESVITGNTASRGGGIRNDGGRAFLIESQVEENVVSGSGGGIQSSGVLTIHDSMISGNRARDGGGIDSTGEAGQVWLVRSTVSGNIASGRGGGLLNFLSPASVTLINSTVSSNRATEGGGLYNIVGPGSLTLTHSTVSANASTGNGGGLFVETIFLMGIVRLSNTIIAEQLDGQDCFDDGFTAFLSEGFNLDSDNTCHLTQPDDTPSGHANLGPLQMNPPGLTATHTLRANSDAINMGDCSGGTVVDDQRGVSRPQGPECDIGALEVAESLVLACDVNQDRMVDRSDIQLIFSARNSSAIGSDDRRDQDGDGLITVTDGRLCALECTNPGCMPSDSE